MEARRLSTLSSIGLPMPAGRPTAAHSMTPPTESCSSRASSMAASMASSARGLMTGYSCSRSASSCAPVTSTSSNGISWICAMDWMCEPTVTPCPRSHSLHSAPANTSGAVRRPEKWPPPRGSLQDL